MPDISSEERKRLDFFALETLVRCMLAVIIRNNPDDVERKFVKMFEAAVDDFQLAGADADKIPELRDYMKQQGLRWIASVSPDRRDQRN